MLLFIQKKTFFGEKEDDKSEQTSSRRFPPAAAASLSNEMAAPVDTLHYINMGRWCVEYIPHGNHDTLH